MSQWLATTTHHSTRPQQPLLTTTTTKTTSDRLGPRVPGWMTGRDDEWQGPHKFFVHFFFISSIYLTFFVFSYFTCDDDDERHQGHNQDEQKSAQDTFFFSMATTTANTTWPSPPANERPKRHPWRLLGLRYVFLILTNVYIPIYNRAVHCHRIDGSMASVWQLPYPYRRDFKKKMNGTATVWIYPVKSRHHTAVNSIIWLVRLIMCMVCPL